MIRKLPETTRVNLPANGRLCTGSFPILCCMCESSFALLAITLSQIHRQICCIAVHCSWSSWSDWGECLGPCDVQSVQWSFRSPNNPTKHGDGRTCRGIYRKARRYVALLSQDCFHYPLSITLNANVFVDLLDLFGWMYHASFLLS